MEPHALIRESSDVSLREVEAT